MNFLASTYHIITRFPKKHSSKALNWQWQNERTRPIIPYRRCWIQTTNRIDNVKGNKKTSIIITYRNKSSDTQDWILRTPGALQAWPPQDDLRPLAPGHRLPWRWQNAAERHKQMLLVKFHIREATRTPVSNRFVKFHEMMLRDRMQGETKKRDCRHSHGSWACVAKARAKKRGKTFLKSSVTRSLDHTLLSSGWLSM